MIVRPKPSAVCTAIRLPAISGGAASAISAENCGLSGTTNAPQIRISTKDSQTGPPCASATAMAMTPETTIAPPATSALPIRSAIRPPITQVTAPMAMAAKAVKAANSSAAACSICIA